MIRRLRIRMTLMVIAVLILVSAGIVLATHLSNEQNMSGLFCLRIWKDLFR